ncbi:MAG: hypothetical protein WA952_13430 [Lewinella sp.]
MAIVVIGIWLTNFPLLGDEPPKISVICQFTAPDGQEYTVYQNEGGTTVGNSVGVYRGHEFEAATFNWWAYAVGDQYRAGLSGDLPVVMVSKNFSDSTVTDTLVFDLSKESDYRLNADQLMEPIVPLDSLSIE